MGNKIYLETNIPYVYYRLVPARVVGVGFVVQQRDHKINLKLASGEVVHVLDIELMPLAIALQKPQDFLWRSSAKKDMTCLPKRFLRDE